MTALMWKDYRMNRALLVTAGAMLVMPYVIGVLLHLFDGSWRDMTAWHWGQSLVAMAVAAMACSLLPISFLAANAFSSERMDRSAEFLVTLPPSRWAILTSKLLVSSSASGVVWIANLAVIWLLIPALGGGEPWLNPTTGDLFVTTVLVFSAGWAASTVMSSPVGAWGAAVAAPTLVCGLLFSIAHFFGRPTGDEFRYYYSVVSLSLSAVLMFTSSFFYLRRVAP